MEKKFLHEESLIGHAGKSMHAMQINDSSPEKNQQYTNEIGGQTWVEN